MTAPRRARGPKLGTINVTVIMEARMRSIPAGTDVLQARPKPKPDLTETIRRRFAPIGGADLEPHSPIVIAGPPRFA